MRKVFIVLALLCILITSCGAKVDCSSTAYNELTQTYREEWDTTITTSLTRFPGNLEPIKRDLERIMGEYQGLEIPACLQPAHDKFLAGMALDMQGVLEFDETGDVSDQFQLADAEYASAQEELMKLDQ